MVEVAYEKVEKTHLMTFDLGEGKGIISEISDNMIKKYPKLSELLQFTELSKY